jgi:aspartate aminotransferase
MATEPVSRRIEGIAATLAPTLRFFTTSTWARRQGDPGIADFALGNPHEMPLLAFANALARWSVPQSKDWFAYTTSRLHRSLSPRRCASATQSHSKPKISS